MLKIAEARSARGWTQKQLADAVGTTQQTIQRWESGETDPQVSKLVAISKHLDVTMSYLLDIGHREESEDDQNEQCLIEMYRSLPIDKKELVISLVESLADEKC